MLDSIEETNMDRQDLQDHFRSDLEFGEIIEQTIGCAFAPERPAQIINYLKATGIEVSLLIHFGIPKLEYKRFLRQK